MGGKWGETPLPKKKGLQKIICNPLIFQKCRGTESNCRHGDFEPFIFGVVLWATFVLATALSKVMFMIRKIEPVYVGDQL